MARFKTTEGLDTSKPYILSQYCGRDYRIMRFSGGEWARSTGSMKQVNGKWVITGDVLNPVSGYELITYDAMDWFMGVSSVDDMMAPVKTQSSWVSKLNLGQETYPAWTQYFECMVDDDQLQEDLAMGRKVPYELFNVLQFCDSCDYSKKELAATWKKLWRDNAWKYMSIASLLAYYTFTDYLAAVDQQAKNMQPMFFLEEAAGLRMANTTRRPRWSRCACTSTRFMTATPVMVRIMTVVTPFPPNLILLKMTSAMPAVAQSSGTISVAVTIRKWLPMPEVALSRFRALSA